VALRTLSAMEIAVLDLGSTTFHLQHVRYERSARGEAAITTLDTKRTPLLGAQVFSDGFVDRRSWLESLEAVHELTSASRASKPDQLVVVATSAIRSAHNGPLLVRELERRFDISIRVLDPCDEARLAYLGHTTSWIVGAKRAVVIDLGGGSVEIGLGAGARCVDTYSLPIGAVRLRGREPRARFSRSQARAVAAQVRAALEPTLQRLSRAEPEVVAFGSGSARAARKLLMRGSSAPGKTGPLVLAELRAALCAHEGSTAEQLIDLGVDPPRAQTVLVSATIIAEMMELLGSERAYVSDKGLRDGVALDTYRHLVARRRERVA
jgi:exopolyphosphatase/guanosine-5'-triphosphate,3'-diphosphate pyrophosphatase